MHSTTSILPAQESIFARFRFERGAALPEEVGSLEGQRSADPHGKSDAGKEQEHGGHAHALGAGLEALPKRGELRGTGIHASLQACRHAP